MLQATVGEVMKPEDALELMILVMLENIKRDFSYKQDREKN